VLAVPEEGKKEGKKKREKRIKPGHREKRSWGFGRY
jgi:hypothetical protein